MTRVTQRAHPATGGSRYDAHLGPDVRDAVHDLRGRVQRTAAEGLQQAVRFEPVGEAKIGDLRKRNRIRIRNFSDKKWLILKRAQYEFPAVCSPIDFKSSSLTNRFNKTPMLSISFWYRKEGRESH